MLLPRLTSAVLLPPRVVRVSLRKRYTYFGSMDQRSITFFHEGQNYLRKMCIDLRFLPLPVEQVTVV